MEDRELEVVEEEQEMRRFSEVHNSQREKVSFGFGVWDCKSDVFFEFFCFFVVCLFVCLFVCVFFFFSFFKFLLQELTTKSLFDHRLLRSVDRDRLGNSYYSPQKKVCKKKSER